MKNKKTWVFILIALAVLLLNNKYRWSEYLGNAENLNFIKTIAAENFWQAVLLYIIITIISCVALALPGITFALFAGAIFGPFLGIIFCLTATTIGASAAFLVGRFFLKDAIKPMAQKNKHLKKLLFDESNKNDMIVLMITRLVPLFPYNLQNFLYGATDISFWKYTAYTFIFMFPGVSFITIGAAGITAEANKGWYFLLAGLLFIVVTAVGYLLQKKYIDTPHKEI
ncbi:MAG: VTT domain-containing protein [Oscillospiraceae bacterium]